MANKKYKIPLPKWVPNHFKELLDGPYPLKYRRGLDRIMAVDLKETVLSMGESIVKSIRNGDILAENESKELLKRLAKCFTDPFTYEAEIINIQKKWLQIKKSLKKKEVK